MKTVIKSRLAEKGMRVIDLHRSIGGSRTLCYQLSKGHSRATRPQRKRVAEALEVLEEELFDETGMPLPAGEEQAPRS